MNLNFLFFKFSYLRKIVLGKIKKVVLRIVDGKVRRLTGVFLVDIRMSIKEKKW